MLGLHGLYSLSLKMKISNKTVNDILNHIIGGYFQIVAGNCEDKNFLKMDIAEIRYCDRIRRPGLFMLKDGKRLFPTPKSMIYMRGNIEQDPLLKVINWSKIWVTYNPNGIVIVKNSYIGGYVLE